jgi:hypothetical protein
MPVPFAGWTLREADARLAAVVSAHLKTNRLFVDGDHWQQGQGWIGPSPQPGQDGFDETLRELQRSFTSRNAIGETTERHAQALLGREPAFGLTVRRALAEGEEATAQEQAKIDEAEAALTAWWDVRGIAGTLAEATRTVLWAADPDGHGRAPLRLYVPRGFLLDGEMDVTGADGVERKVPSRCSSQRISRTRSRSSTSKRPTRRRRRWRATTTRSAKSGSPSTPTSSGTARWARRRRRSASSCATSTSRARPFSAP